MNMKNILIILFVFTVLSFFVNASEGDIEEEQIKVAFSSNIESVIGFSSSDVKGITQSDITNIDNTTKAFHFDSTEREYNLGDETENNIFVYAQIFSTTSAEVKIKLNPLVATDNSGVSLIWETSNTIPVYDGTKYVNQTLKSDGQEIVVYHDDGGNIPRVFSRQIIPIISTEEVNKAGTATKFRGSIVASLFITT